MSVRSLGRTLRLVAVVCTAAVGACARQAPAADTTTKTASGPELFARACAKCHSDDGSGGLPMVANGPRPISFRDSVWQASRSDTELVAAIRDGRGAMPPFGDVLNPTEIAALAAHVRSLNPGTR